MEHLHLYPMFEELEQGICPSAVEMAALLNNNVRLEQIYPQYFEKNYYEKKVEVLKSSDEPKKERSFVRHMRSCAHSPCEHESCEGNFKFLFYIICNKLSFFCFVYFYVAEFLTIYVCRYRK